MMRTSQKGINLIKEFEGCRLKAYKCPAGVWTIGYGHTSNVKPRRSGKITSRRFKDVRTTCRKYCKRIKSKSV